MTVVATEDFSGAAGPLNGTQTTTGGLVWQAFGVYTANRNNVQRDGAGKGMGGAWGQGLAYINAGSPDHYAQIQQYTNFSSHMAVCAAVAAVDHKNFIALAPFYGTNWFKLIKYVEALGSEYVTVADFTGLTLTAGDVFRIEREGTTVKCFQNGAPLGNAGGYTVNDAVFAGCTNVGIWVYGSPPAGTFDNFEGGTMGVPVGGAITFTTAPVANSVLQRGTSNTKSISIGGGYTGTVPADLQWRLENEAGALIAGYDWTTIAGATIGGGTWSASVTVPHDTARGGYKIAVRSRTAGGAVMDTKLSPSFTVGVIVEGAGQSNMEAQFQDGGPAPVGKSAFWDGAAWQRTNTKRFNAAVNTISDVLGVPVGVFTTAVSASGARAHAPAHTSTDGAVAEGQYWPSFTAKLAQVGGDLEGCIWYQGEANVGGSMQQWTDAVNARIAGMKTATGRTAAGQFSFGVVTLGKYVGQDDAAMETMRATQLALATTTPGAFHAADAVSYALADSVHLAATEYVQLAYCEGRSFAVARGASTYNGIGPAPQTASRDGSTVTVAFNLNGATGLTGSGVLTGWEFYNGSTWATATDAAVVGSSVQFTGVGATQVRYLYGANPTTTNVVRGNVKAAPGAANPLPVEPTRQAVAVTAGMPTIYVRPLIWDGQRMRRMGPGDVIDAAIKALFT